MNNFSFSECHINNVFEILLQKLKYVYCVHKNYYGETDNFL